MTHYLIKYTGHIWSVERVFTHRYAAEEYKQLLDSRNTSSCQYMIVVCPHVGGLKYKEKEYLPQLVNHKLKELGIQTAA